MVNITVKGVPDEVHEQLKKRANYHRRSVNSEIIVVLERSLIPMRKNTEEVIDRAKALKEDVSRKLSWEEIKDAINKGRL